METNKILNADLLDIIFDGKNKSYGAYELRKSYNSRLTKALIFTGALLLLIFVGTVFANILDKYKADKEIDVLDTQMAEVKKDEPPPPPPPPPPTPPPPPEVNQVKFTPPKIVKDEEVKPEEKIEEIKEEQVISTKTVESDNTNQVVQAPVETTGNDIPQDDENKIFTKVEVDASYLGGESAWRRYLSNNLDASVPGNEGAPPGTYTVIVRFIVAKDGSVSDVVAETDHGYGMEKESVRAIKKSGKWTPAIQNGRNVTAYKRQPITWVVQE
jgi:protein TonB